MIGIFFILEINYFKGNYISYTDDLLPKIAVLISALGYVTSAILAYNLKNTNSVSLTTYVTIIAAIMSLPFFLFAEINNPSVFRLNSILPIIYLGIFPTAIAFLLRFYLISKAGPVFLSYVAYLIPGFAILWGFIFLKETVSYITLIGVILVLIGVFISQKKFNEEND